MTPRKWPRTLVSLGLALIALGAGLYLFGAFFYPTQGGAHGGGLSGLGAGFAVLAAMAAAGLGAILALVGILAKGLRRTDPPGDQG